MRKEHGVVVIEGMKVPSECRVCKLSNVTGNFCKVTRKHSDPDVRPEWCPIQEIPEGCGRLIDADALFKDIISSFDIKDRNYFLASEQAIVDCIGRAPTVIV